MKTIPVYIFCALLCMFFTSCASDDVKILRDKLASGYQMEQPTTGFSNVAISQYVDAEKGLNKYYVYQLENLINSGFSKQVDDFEKKELGFFRSYKYMFQTIFLSRDKNEDIWNVKASQYFSTIELQQDALNCYNEYARMLEEYRSRFISDVNLVEISCAPELKIPEQEVYLGALQDYSRKNLLIEFGVDAAVWLLILLVIAILGLLGVAWTGGYSIVAFILSMIISIVLSVINDNTMIKSIEQQEKKIESVNYQRILQDLDSNTISFYEVYMQ